MSVSLIPILPASTDPMTIEAMPQSIQEVVAHTRKLYDYAGFHEPWVGYLAIDDADDHIVGTCGFKSRPSGGRVEIAYYTFPENEGRGIATAMARALVALAQDADPEVSVIAQTQPQEGPSTRILEKLSFQKLGAVEHPEDGTIWEWEAPRTTSGNG